MSVKTRVRATSETVVGDPEIQYQRSRIHRVHKVGRQFKIPTTSTPVFSYVLFRLDFMCCVEYECRCDERLETEGKELKFETPLIKLLL